MASGLGGDPNPLEAEGIHNFFIPVLADEFPAFNPNGFIPNFVLALC